MASFPNSIASFSAAVDYETVVDASIDNGQWAEIVAIETVLGVDPATIGATADVEGTVGYNIDTLFGDVSTLTSGVTALHPSSSTPQPVGAAGASGSSGQTSDAAHIHAGVTGLTGAGLKVSATTGSVTVGPAVVRTNTTSEGTSFTPDVDTSDVFVVGVPSGNFTINNPTGTPVDNQKLIIRIAAPSTYSVTWGSAYANSGIFSLPASFPDQIWFTLGFMYNATNSSWVLLAADTVGYV